MIKYNIISEDESENNMDPVPYKGNEPYIFISYAHRNIKKVFPILEKMQEDRYRLWFDEGIDPGVEWDENIASHINNSGYFIAFITKDYLESRNCKDELFYARNNDKNTLIVYLEKVDLPAGIDLRVGKIQAVHWYRYNDIGRAFEKLYETHGLEICRPDEALPPPPPTPPTPPQPPFSKLLRIVLGLLFILMITALFVWHPWNKGLPNAQPEETVTPASISDDSGPEDEPEDSWKTEMSGVIEAEAGTEVQEPQNTGTESAADTDDIRMQRITLTANESMSIRDFISAADIISGRIKLLTGDLPYEMNVVEDRIELNLPVEAFKGHSVADVLRGYISRAVDLFMFTDENGLIKARENKLHVSRDDIESVTLMHGAIPNADVSEYGIRKKEYPYIMIVLKDEFSEAYHEQIAAWGDHLKFGQDMENDAWFSWNSFQAGDGKTFYLLENIEDIFYELMVYNLAHDKLAYSFYYNIVVAPVWETVEQAQFPGVNQCDPDALPREAVQLIYQPISKELSEGEWLDTQNIFKMRLDALGCPYSFGTTSDPYEIAVKISSDHYSRRVMELAGERWLSSGIDVVSGTLRNSGFKEFHCKKDEQGNWGIVISFYDSDVESLDVFKKLAADSGNPLILRVNNLPWFSGLPDSESGSIRFDQVLFNDKGKIGAEYSWLMNFLEICMNMKQSLPETYEIASETFDMNADMKDSISFDSDFQKIKDTILAKIPDADLQIKGDMAQVFLDLPVDESLPEKATDLAREIYESVSLFDCPFDSIGVFLIEEEDEERGRIFFSKHYGLNTSAQYRSGDFEEGYCYVYGRFSGGRLEEYKDRFNSIVENDDFYTGLWVDSSSFWIF